MCTREGNYNFGVEEKRERNERNKALPSCGAVELVLEVEVDGTGIKVGPFGGAELAAVSK